VIGFSGENHSTTKSLEGLFFLEPNLDKSESKYTVLKERLILLFMFGMLVSVAISSFLSFRILKKGFWENMKSDQKQ